MSAHLHQRLDKLAARRLVERDVAFNGNEVTVAWRYVPRHARIAAVTEAKVEEQNSVRRRHAWPLVVERKALPNFGRHAPDAERVRPPNRRTLRPVVRWPASCSAAR